MNGPMARAPGGGEEEGGMQEQLSLVQLQARRMRPCMLKGGNLHVENQLHQYRIPAINLEHEKLYAYACEAPM